MNYTPDRWILIKINYTDDPLYKILVGWCGGYLDGDSWKLNSGITKVEEFDNYYVVHGYSGSSYICNKNAYGVTGLTSSVLSNFKKQAQTSSGTIEEFDFKTTQEIFSTLKG